MTTTDEHRAVNGAAPATTTAAATAATLAALRAEGAFALLAPPSLGGDGATVADAAALVQQTAERDGSAAYALGAHYAATATLLAVGEPDAAAAVLHSPAAAASLLSDGRSLPEPAERLGLRGVPEAVRPAGLPLDAPLLEALRALFDAAVAAGLALGSVAAAAEFTRRRPRPRPVPGVESATTDPFSQTLLGQGLSEAWGAAALVRSAAAELTDLLTPATPAGRWRFATVSEGRIDIAPPAGTGVSLRDASVAAARDRALAALEVALTTAQAQGDRVWQVVGTSGTANALGFDAPWRDARALAMLNARGARRRQIGRSELAAA